ncbi:MAG: hypothetical protein M1530_02390 [Candidatus Marsarchaeota archaeon]|nr:hypothetical protein [Candidatus Marsarchaeota archaeon]
MEKTGMMEKRARLAPGAGSRMQADAFHIGAGSMTILLLLVLSRQQNAQFTSVTGTGALPGQPYDVSSIFGSQGPLAGTVLLLGLITLFGATLIYMFGVALNIQSFKNWAKSEFMQIIVTFLLMACILVAYGQTWTMMINAVSGIYKTTQPQMADPNLYYEPFSFTQSYISTTLIDCEKKVYNTLYTINFYYRLVGRLQADALGADPLGGWSTTVYTGFFEYVTGHINYLLLLNYIQVRLLTLIKYAMPLLLEAGLVLRVFPLSRGAGGLLIAIGLGFYAVYPVSIAILMTLLPGPTHSFCTGFNPPPLLDLSDGGVVQTSGDLLQVAFSAKASGSQIGSLRTQIETFLPVFYLQGMFLPLVAFTITFTFVRQTGALFGSDLNEIGRGLIKLI